MSVITDLDVPADAFELGRILDVDSPASIELETMIPLGEKAVPFFRVDDAVGEDFQRRVASHDAVTDITLLDEHDDSRLYALDWDVSQDLFFQTMLDADATLLTAKGGTETWAFELRFPDYEAVSRFQEGCRSAEISLTVERIYNPTRPDAGMWYGLTEPQRTTIVRAVQGGYYSIPRRMSTKDLADELDISDQAVTERLRRAIITLVENTLIAEAEAHDGVEHLH